MILFIKRMLFLAICYTVGIFFGFVAICRLIWCTFKEGTGILKYKPRQQAPAVLNDKSLGVHDYVITKSKIKFHYVANGKVDNPLMLCIHGFPEFWYSWRFQLTEFSKDYRVVAVDTRGYGFTDKPKNKSSYGISYLSQDVKEIVDALGYSSCILVGHDWGGMISWSVAHRYPDIVRRLIILNCPHPKSFSDTMSISVFGLKQFLMSWYIFFYHLPYLPELKIYQKDFAMIKVVFKGRFCGVKNKENMTDDDIDAYKFAMSQPGAVTSALNYYRNLADLVIDEDWMKNGQTRVTSPTLVIWGDQDRFLSKDLLNSLPSVVENLKIKFVGGASHWVQQDEPQIVNDYIREYLKST